MRWLPADVKWKGEHDDGRIRAKSGCTSIQRVAACGRLPTRGRCCEAEPDHAAKPLPEGTAIILFADIVDSTALTEQLGDAAFRARATRLDAAMRSGIRECGGTPVEGKVLGDGVLAVFTSARQAIDAAQRCLATADGTGLALHLGIHAGDVIREGDNVYGGAVNIAFCCVGHPFRISEEHRGGRL